MIDPWLVIHPVGITASAVMLWGTFVPQSRLWGNVVSRGDARSAAVALTFDDGPTPGPTERVLDMLGEAGAKAAFFVVGQNCRRHPRLVARMHDEGHLVANHTFDHAHLGVLRGRRYWTDQLRRTDDAIADAIGLRPALFRPPMGHKTCFTLAAVRRLKLGVVGWTHGARDGLPTTKARILERFEDVDAGDVLLLHDGVQPNTPDRDPAATLEALPTLLARIKDRGLAFARVDTLLGFQAYRDDGVA